MLRDNSDVSWEKWGQEDPYFGVLTDERFRTQSLTSEVKAEFFESGRSHIDMIMGTIERRFGEMVSRKSALDFGCGVGRLVIPLTRLFDQVTGVDISPSSMVCRTVLLR